MERHKECLHMICYAAKLKRSYIFRSPSSRHQGTKALQSQKRIVACGEQANCDFDL
jgi:hypothetical protein